MLTQNEINSLSLSPTKKDFVQIWNELLEVAGKLSERWDPTSTNESDPGIVILKALTGIADKLNYNIDKNTLEAFMPTAAQEESMRKLCDMLGYNIKYYRSATTEATIKWYNAEPEAEEATKLQNGLAIPKFTVLSNSDQDINYFTTNEDDIFIFSASPYVKVPCMEGQIVKCESLSDNNIITANQISENNRFYLPEAHIAENGLFVYNVVSSNTLGGTGVGEGAKWTKVDNLNTQPSGVLVYKFGFDSYEGRPYIEFPEDYCELFNDGIFIYYTRTSGASGNISARTLTKLEAPSNEDWKNISVESFSVENEFPANNGTGIETIGQAYNNFKKTIGTFETLITCRDYMNKIYSMMDDYGNFYVSNILVTDIRDDINRAVTICSCDDAGIFYKETPITQPVTRELKIKDSDEIIEVEDQEPAITHFDLVLYPFKSYSQIRSTTKDIRKAYDASYTYNPQSFEEIKRRLEADNIQTIAHNLTSPRSSSGDIVSINNYLRLNATIATNSKVTYEEGLIIKEKIKIALANAFNMRTLDFGEEIPFDSIIEVIENADPRVRIAALNDPTLYTTYSVFEQRIGDKYPVVREYAVKSGLWLSDAEAETVSNLDTSRDSNGNYIGTFNTVEAKKIYNKLALRNVLAGRIPLFDYNNTFKTSFSEGIYQVTTTATYDEILSFKDEYLQVSDTNRVAIYTTSDDSNNTITYTAYYNPDNDKKVDYYKSFIPSVEHQQIASEPSTEKTNSVLDIVTEIDGNNIASIEANCVITPSEPKSNIIKGVTLSAGEFVKFRAPNFTTIKTYPAYVNYYLDLNDQLHTTGEAKAAEANTLFDILNSNTDNWDTVLKYFSNKKTFTLSKKVSAYTENAVTESDLCSNTAATNGTHEDDGSGKCKFCKASLVSTIFKEPIKLEPKLSADESEISVEEYLYQSGCIKLSNVELDWDAADDEVVPPSTDALSNLFDAQPLLESPFITKIDDLNIIKTTIDNALAELAGKTKENGDPVLPSCSWEILLTFECVPFQAASFDEWKTFITSPEFKKIFTLEPEGNTLLWRSVGEGYDLGKYVLADTQKLVKFDKQYFGFLENFATALSGVYLMKSFGKDLDPALIENNEEYQLKNGEHLYIEYTPSSTAEDGTTTTSAPVTEQYGEGTIIRPSGFELGLIDSSNNSTQSHVKEVTFKTDDNGTNLSVYMLSLGVNEQIEIRDFARVTIGGSQTSDVTTSSVYLYKNFDCEELDRLTIDHNAAKRTRINNTYTLKDGEYIFYTDQNKAEFAYYAAGTQVTLTGNLVLGEFTKVDISTIFDEGPSVIPWARKALSENDSITFTEYQYITLGPDDTINELRLLETLEGLSSQWQYCSKVSYSAAGSTTPETLPKIRVNTTNIDPSRQAALEGSDGWEAASMLNLNVAYDFSQVLRNTENVTSSIILTSASSGGDTNVKFIEIKPDKGQSLSFKTNLICQSSSGKINIDDVYYNPNKVKGFEFKFFSPDAPVIVETASGKVIPRYDSGIKDIANWPGDALTTKDSFELWNSVGLDAIRSALSDNSTDYDKALRLPISLLPNTYGVFCIYLKYAENSRNKNTWIEVAPGVSAEDITILNTEPSQVTWENTKLLLKPGINCIRVNKSGRIFIKTEAEAEGTLFFDELRLVNCKQILYKDESDTEGMPITTQGLNISQLGYLDPSDISGILTSEAKDKLRAAYIDEAFNNLTSLNDTKNTDFKSIAVDLLSTKPKVQDLKDFVTDAKEQLETLITKIESDDTDSYNNLFNQYANLDATLARELDLLNALKENENADVVQQNLVEMLNDFSNIDSLQSLLTELATLKTESLLKVTQATKSEVIAAFNRLDDADKRVFEDIISTTAASLLDESFNSQLATIANSLESINNSEDRAKLVSAFNSIKSANQLEQRANLLAAIRQLSETINRTELNSTLDTMLTYATDTDFAELEILLRNLSSNLNSQDFNTLISEIELAVNSEDDSRLLTLVQELSGLVTDKLAPTGESAVAAAAAAPDSLDVSISMIVYNIDKILEYIESYFNAEEDKKPGIATNITNSTRSLYKMLSENYMSKLDTLLTEILIILSGEDLSSGGLIGANNSYTDMLSRLQNSKNSQVANVVTRLTTLLNNYESYHSKINDNVPNIANSCPEETKIAIEEAINTVWASEFKARLQASLTNYYDDIYTAISEKELDRLPDSDVSDLKDYLIDNTFIDKVIIAINTYEQNNARQSLIAEIGQMLPNSPAVIAAMNAIANTNSHGALAEIISNIINSENLDFQAHQALMNDLKTELNKSIEEDHKLIETVAGLLCPNLLCYTSKISNLIENDFYSGFIMQLKSLKDELLDSIEWTARKDTLATALKFFMNILETDINIVVDSLDIQSLDRLKAALVKLDLNSYKELSILPDSWPDKVKDLAIIAHVQNIINNIKILRNIFVSSKIDEITTKLEETIGGLITDAENLTGQTLIPTDIEAIDSTLNDLCSKIRNLETASEVDERYVDAAKLWDIEEKLLKAIRNIDVYRDFYYTIPIENNLAIEFNDSKVERNTLMNPAMNYNVNNINNNFVISKLDIDYLDTGLQIARSSRLN